MKTGSTGGQLYVDNVRSLASMEPGREDREHVYRPAAFELIQLKPQWNPAVKTGSTRAAGQQRLELYEASMEPGREDREHLGLM